MSNEEIKKIKEDIEEIKVRENGIFLSWKKLIAICLAASGAFGYTFTKGMNISKEASKLDMIRMEQEHQKQVCDKDAIYNKLELEMKKVGNDRDYYKERYDTIVARLKECEEGM